MTVKYSGRWKDEERDKERRMTAKKGRRGREEIRKRCGKKE